MNLDAAALANPTQLANTITDLRKGVSPERVTVTNSAQSRATAAATTNRTVCQKRKTVSWKIGVTGAGATHDAERANESDGGRYTFSRQRAVRNVVFGDKCKAAITKTAVADTIKWPS